MSPGKLAERRWWHYFERRFAILFVPSVTVGLPVRMSARVCVSICTYARTLLGMSEQLC
jgi:hypothetical protein